jgi:molecular chaperone GrpE
MENLRKRTEKEKADLRKFAISEFARDVLSIGDNIQRALDHVPEDAAERDPALKSFREGVQLLERELLAVLERHGVRRIVPDLEPFNPHLHQAVMEEQNPAVPAGTVLQVFQAGFIIDERCLRPAMVSVSRGGPKPAKPEAQVGAADTQGPTDGAGSGEPGAGEGGAETG